MDDELKDKDHLNIIARYTDLSYKYTSGRHRYDMDYISYKIMSEWKLIGETGILNGRVANIGCGECLEELWFLPLAEKWDSFDCTPKVIEKAIELIQSVFSPSISSKFNGHVTDCRHLRTKEKYDVVLCLSVLEHLREMDDIILTLKNIHSLMDTNAKAVISISGERNDLYSDYVNDKIAHGEYAWEKPLDPDFFSVLLNKAGLKVIDLSSEMHICNGTDNVFMQKINVALMPLGSRLGFLVEKIT